MIDFDTAFAANPLIAILRGLRPDEAADTAAALTGAGFTVLEVPLNSPDPLDSIARMVAAAPDAVVGAGTVLTPDDAKRAKEAGATFAVSPGLTDRLIAACEELELPLLPGAATASEVMRAADAGYDMLKFFPAEAIGGARALKSLAGPLPKIGFCPTGGISPANAGDYLSLPNVVCIGGSWIATDADVSAENWGAIQERAHAASRLSRG